MDVGEPALEREWNRVDGAPLRQVTAIVIGCGQRGQNYAAFAQDFPGRLKIAGVAEPVTHRRNMMKRIYKLEDVNCVGDWRVWASSGSKLADAVIICTQDKGHKVKRHLTHLLIHEYCLVHTTINICRSQLWHLPILDIMFCWRSPWQ